MLLMTFATKSLLSVSAGATRVAGFAITPAVALVKALIHRREVLRLGELDERSLKDIGLVRSDLDGALAVSWLLDPTVILAERSSARSGVAAKRREAGLQQPVMTASAVKAQPVAAARSSASKSSASKSSASKPSATKPLASRAEAVNPVTCCA